MRNAARPIRSRVCHYFCPTPQESLLDATRRKVEPKADEASRAFIAILLEKWCKFTVLNYVLCEVGIWNRLGGRECRGRGKLFLK